MRAVDLIAKKRSGDPLSEAEWRWLVNGYLDGTVSEGQVAALLMAGVLKGISDEEAQALTAIFVDSGETLDLGDLPPPTIDKHSTGGVSDGTTLLVAPLLAAAGATVMKLSGRGLGHTGGTLDKLESIPGLRTALAPEHMRRIAADVGCVVAAQTDRLVPADRAFYALRDVTATVDSVALIAASVMSKKLAGGAETIVLDVKAGNGAFMATATEAEALAELCVRIGTAAGRRCTALVTAMDQPLGRAVGNALEVAEAVELLSHPPAGRLAELSLELAATALSAAQGGEPETLRADLSGRWERGEALDRLRRMVVAQDGDRAVCDRPREVLPRAPVRAEAVAAAGGVVNAVPARAIGDLAGSLGAGRARKDDKVDPRVGVELSVEVGDRVDRGDLLAVVHAADPTDAESAVKRLQSVIGLGEDTPRPDTILGRVGA